MSDSSNWKQLSFERVVSPTQKISKGMMKKVKARTMDKRQESLGNSHGGLHIDLEKLESISDEQRSKSQGDKVSLTGRPIMEPSPRKVSAHDPIK